jgi:hypothetical protein
MFTILSGFEITAEANRLQPYYSHIYLDGFTGLPESLPCDIMLYLATLDGRLSSTVKFFAHTLQITMKSLFYTELNVHE